jgi:diacylglycerol kinase
MKFIRSFYHAFRGISTAVKTELNLRVHLCVAAFVIAAGFYVGLTAFEWMVVVLCICSVITTELINTAIEQLCNHVTKEQHEAIKKVKDISAAAVLLVSVGAAIVGIIIFLPKLISLYNL